MSYKDYLLRIVKADPGVIPYYQADTHGLYGIGIDAVPAQDCWAIGLPGFRRARPRSYARRADGELHRARADVTPGQEAVLLPLSRRQRIDRAAPRAVARAGGDSRSVRPKTS